jgi:hypothetical protein
VATVQSLIGVSHIIPQIIAPALGNAMFAFSIQHTNILGGNLFWFILLALGKRSAYASEYRPKDENILGSISVAQSFKLQESKYDWRVRNEAESPN